MSSQTKRKYNGRNIPYVNTRSVNSEINPTEPIIYNNGNGGHIGPYIKNSLTISTGSQEKWPAHQEKSGKKNKRVKLGQLVDDSVLFQNYDSEETTYPLIRFIGEDSVTSAWTGPENSFHEGRSENIYNTITRFHYGNTEWEPALPDSIYGFENLDLNGSIYSTSSGFVLLSVETTSGTSEGKNQVSLTTTNPGNNIQRIDKGKRYDPPQDEDEDELGGSRNRVDKPQGVKHNKKKEYACIHTKHSPEQGHNCYKLSFRNETELKKHLETDHDMSKSRIEGMKKRKIMKWSQIYEDVLETPQTHDRLEATIGEHGKGEGGPVEILVAVLKNEERSASLCKSLEQNFIGNIVSYSGDHSSDLAGIAQTKTQNIDTSSGQDPNSEDDVLRSINSRDPIIEAVHSGSSSDDRLSSNSGNTDDILFNNILSLPDSPAGDLSFNYGSQREFAQPDVVFYIVNPADGGKQCKGNSYDFRDWLYNDAEYEYPDGGFIHRRRTDHTGITKLIKINTLSDLRHYYEKLFVKNFYKLNKIEFLKI